MTSRAIAPLRSFPSGAVLLFPFLGPLLTALIPALIIGLLGLVTLHLAGLAAGLKYLCFWLPRFYWQLALPFLLTGAVFALIVRYLPFHTLALLLVSAAVAFPVYLTGGYWITGSMANACPQIGADPLCAGLVILAAVGLCWWPVHRCL